MSAASDVLGKVWGMLENTEGLTADIRSLTPSNEAARDAVETIRTNLWRIAETVSSANMDRLTMNEGQET